MGAMDPGMRAAFLKGMIPGEVLRELDDAELRDRLAKAHELLLKSDQADSPALRKAFGAMAADVLVAQPRAKTEAEVTRQLRKAATAATREEAAQARARAAQIQQANPVAPRRSAAPKPAGKATTRHLGPDAVWTEVYDKSGRRLGRTPATAIRKAKNDKPLLVCFDQNGDIIGLVDPEKLQPIGNTPAKPEPAKTPQAPATGPTAQQQPAQGDVAKGARRRVDTGNTVLLRKQQGRW